MTETLRCSQCGESFEKDIAQANRQRRALGARIRFFCGQRCFGLSRRTHKTKAQRVAEKAAYDRGYRAKNIDRITANKRDYFQRTYNPGAARRERRQRRDIQRAYAKDYNARPENKAHKASYDRRFRAMDYGDFAECHLLLVELEKAIRVQPWYERAKERGYFDNNRSTQLRKRNEHISRW